MGFAASIPAALRGAANDSLESQGFGPGIFSIPFSSGQSVTHYLCHAWTDPEFQTAVMAIPGARVAGVSGTPTDRIEAATDPLPGAVGEIDGEFSLGGGGGEIEISSSPWITAKAGSSIDISDVVFTRQEGSGARLVAVLLDGHADTIKFTRCTFEDNVMAMHTGEEENSIQSLVFEDCEFYDGYHRRVDVDVRPNAIASVLIKDNKAHNNHSSVFFILGGHGTHIAAQDNVITCDQDFYCVPNGLYITPFLFEGETLHSYRNTVEGVKSLDDSRDSGYIDARMGAVYCDGDVSRNNGLCTDAPSSELFREQPIFQCKGGQGYGGALAHYKNCTWEIDPDYFGENMPPPHDFWQIGTRNLIVEGCTIDVFRLRKPKNSDVLSVTIENTTIKARNIELDDDTPMGLVWVDHAGLENTGGITLQNVTFEFTNNTSSGPAGLIRLQASACDVLLDNVATLGAELDFSYRVRSNSLDSIWSLTDINVNSETDWWLSHASGIPIIL